MRSAVRAMIGVLLLLKEEWGKARIDQLARQSLHEIDVLCDSEFRTMRRYRIALERLQKEAAQALVQNPAAQEFIVAMWKERMQQLAISIKEKAGQRKRPVA